MMKFLEVVIGRPAWKLVELLHALKHLPKDLCLAFYYNPMFEAWRKWREYSVKTSKPKKIKKKKASLEINNDGFFNKLKRNSYSSEFEKKYLFSYHNAANVHPTLNVSRETILDLVELYGEQEATKKLEEIEFGTFDKFKYYINVRSKCSPKAIETEQQTADRLYYNPYVPFELTNNGKDWTDYKKYCLRDLLRMSIPDGFEFSFIDSKTGEKEIFSKSKLLKILRGLPLSRLGNLTLKTHKIVANDPKQLNIGRNIKHPLNDITEIETKTVVVKYDLDQIIKVPVPPKPRLVKG